MVTVFPSWVNSLNIHVPSQNPMKVKQFHRRPLSLEQFVKIQFVRPSPSIAVVFKEYLTKLLT